MINRAREESILKIFNKYEAEPTHAHQVKNIALMLFDKTKDLIHNMSDNERDLLEAGALLHDIGYHVEAKGHNKHAYKLITNEQIPGFTQEENEIIGNIARYHRGKLPKPKHSCYTNLSDSAKRLVDKLGPFARVADGLDGSHCNVVKNIDVNYDSFSRNLIVNLKLNIHDCVFEIFKARDKKDFFEKTFNVEVDFEAL